MGVFFICSRDSPNAMIRGSKPVLPTAGAALLDREKTEIKASTITERQEKARMKDFSKHESPARYEGSTFKAKYS